MPISETWKKSSRSSGNGSCVEVRLVDESVQVRDTKLGEDSPILGVGAAGWAGFAAAVAAGSYDLH